MAVIFGLLLLVFGSADAASKGPARAEQFVAVLGGSWALLWLLIMGMTLARAPAELWREDGAIAYRAHRLAAGHLHSSVLRMPLSRILRVSGSRTSVVMGIAQTTATSRRPGREFVDAIFVDVFVTKRLGIDPDSLHGQPVPLRDPDAVAVTHLGTKEWRWSSTAIIIGCIVVLASGVVMHFDWGPGSSEILVTALIAGVVMALGGLAIGIIGMIRGSRGKAR